MNTAFISLGSNIGDRLSHLKEALTELVKTYPIEVVNVSSIYETVPVGFTDQDLFLNMAAQLNTALSPIELLDALLETEKLLGRKRDIRWGPRTIDLDILLYNDENIITERLVVPHPRLHERSFVVIPLMEIHSDTILPTMKDTLSNIADRLTDREGVRIWREKTGEDVFALFES